MSGYPQYTPEDGQNVDERMAGLVEFLSAYIEQYHGGWVRMVDYDGSVLKVEMGGACIGCPLSPHTLKGWIEGTVRQFFPDIAEVVAVEAADQDQ